MKYGTELVKALESEIATLKDSISDRVDRIDNMETDWDDCFMSQRCESRGIDLAERKIALIKNGGCEWFREFATLNGTLVNAHWCNTRYGSKLRVEMPDGSVVWTTALTKNGLAKKGLKLVDCLRPAWFAFRSSHSGMLGAYTGSYVAVPSDVNYATGEAAGAEPVEVRDAE